ncbi:MAG: UDP-N-acetylmuramate dehydrogenase [Proteobacteria bacterium]|nr:UDP-N-acetylmuramate dehydrogenase [Burkholderiales bacterium]
MNMAEILTLDPQSSGLRGVDRRAVPMAKHVSWRAGGVADRVYTPADLDDLIAFVRSLAPDEPVLMIGLGSNLLVRDGGFRGSVVLLHGVLGALGVEACAGASGTPGSAPCIRVGAGVACPKVARFAAIHGFEGAEFLAGIPGTIGGALTMNAGCYGTQTWERVSGVTMLERSGVLVERTIEAFDIGYRHVALRDAQGGAAALGERAWFVAAVMKFDIGDGERSRTRIRELLARRIATQPLQQPNAGSVFRNPPGDYAARLIEACGLKGCRRGGAEVSMKHANFIVNRGGASAADIEALIDSVQACVRGQTGIELVREVRIVGDRI